MEDYTKPVPTICLAECEESPTAFWKVKAQVKTEEQKEFDLRLTLTSTSLTVALLADFFNCLPSCWRKARDGHRLIGQGRTLWGPSDEAVCQPMLIIADREVRPVMGSTAFLPGEGAGDNGLRDIEK